MNTFVGVGIYQGEFTSDSGLRFLQINLPKIGNKGADVPLYVVPNKAAGDILNSFAPGVRLLLNGRLYPSRQDYKMYFVPNSVIQIVPGSLTLNKVTLGGGYVKAEQQPKPNLLKFTVMSNAPAQPLLNHDWSDSLSFRIEAWEDDAKRIDMLGHKGRQMIMEGILRYSTWQSAEGQTRGGYSIRTRSGLYQFFGKKKVENPDAETRVVTNGKKYEAPQPVVVEPYQSTIKEDKESSTMKTKGEEELPF